VPAEPAESVEIRPLRSHEEYLECVRLQRETWGERFTDVVPATILKVNQRISGVTAGAFDRGGRMLGFVFGMTGVENGIPVHWSDMLAVRPDARGMGLGQRLKEYQREVLLPIGVRTIYWTYDPLVARNAHLNLNRLGADAAEYVPDMYGETDSELHRGLGTDRFVVAWRIGEQRVTDALAGKRRSDQTAMRAAPVVNPSERTTRLPTWTPPATTPTAVRIEIPWDIHEVRQVSPAAAVEWRRTTREAFLWAFAQGYRVTGFGRDEGRERCYYLVSHDADRER
jgi:chorismate synthase